MLPILQGILFLLVGVILLARESMWMKRQLVRLRRRYPEQAEKIAGLSERARAFLRRHGLDG